MDKMYCTLEQALIFPTQTPKIDNPLAVAGIIKLVWCLGIRPVPIHDTLDDVHV